jgi:hypothetical protein
LLLGDVSAPARGIGIVRRILGDALENAEIQLPSGVTLSVLEAESRDANKFQVSIILESTVLNESDLRREAEQLAQAFTRSILHCSSHPFDEKTQDLFAPICEQEQKLAHVIARASRDAQFILSEPHTNFTHNIKLTKQSKAEKNRAAAEFDVTGKIISMPTATDFAVVSSESGEKIVIRCTETKFQAVLRLCFAANFVVSMRVSRVATEDAKERSSAKIANKFVALQSASVVDVVAFEYFQQALRTVAELIGGTLNLLPCSAGKPKTKKSSFENRPRIKS